MLDFFCPNPYQLESFAPFFRRSRVAMSKNFQILPPGTGAAAGLGLQLAVGMVMFVGGGFWLDRRRGGGVLFTLLGIGLGLFYSVYECWKVVQGLSRDAAPKQKNAKQGNNSDHH